MNSDNISPVQRFKLKIRQTNLGQFEVLVTSDMSVSDLKTILSTRINVSPSKQRLICQGKQLQDDRFLSSYKLKEGSVVQLTTKPDLPEPDSQEVPSGRRVRTLDQNERYETLRQNIQTTNLMFSILTPRTEEEIIGFDNSIRQFYLGQWVDVLDTVEQWLEGQITEIANTSLGSMVFVHYNGWPNQWDEWIDSSSSRIQPFHSYTNQSITAPMHSPHPTVPIDENQIRIPGPSEVINFLSSTSQILTKMKGLLERYQKVNTLYKHEKASERILERRTRIGLENIEEVKEWNGEGGSDDDMSGEIEEESVESTEAVRSGDVEMNSEVELGLLTVQTAPLLDRTGRLLSDLSAVVPVGSVPAMPSPMELSQMSTNGRNDMGIHIYAFVTPRRNN